MSAHPARYRAAAATPDGLIVYRTDDRDELTGIEHRHTAAGNTLALTIWDDTADAYTPLEAAA